jgi:PAS domain S-box-containing protein
MDTRSTLFDLLPIGAYRSSIDGRQLRANDALVRLNGYASESEMLAAVNDIGLEWYVQPQRRSEFQQLMQRDGQVLDFVSEVYRHKTRERIWIRENAHLVRGDDAAPPYYEGTVEDITPQRQAELALQASERRFRAFTERAQVLTVVCDAQGWVSYASPAALRLVGFPSEQLQGSNVFDWLHPQDLEPARAEMQAVLGFTSPQVETVCRVHHADGQWRYLAILANNCLADPAVNGVVLNLRDVTGRTRAEEALRALNAELEQRVQLRTLELERARDEAESAHRAKSEFLSRMSHELRTPMHAILGFGQLLQRDATPSLSDASRLHLRELLSAGQRLLGLINELLDLERIEAGELPLMLEPVELAPLLHECLQASTAVAQQHGVQLPDAASLSLAGTVMADRERLKQVLLNLLSNAIKHNLRGGQVGLAVAREGDALRVTVSDTGPGLNEAQRSGLFHAFERLGADRAAFDGAGIGLALSRRLVELMGGQIGLDSEPGQGSRFWVQLACANVAEGRNGTVLYIEDNPVNVLLMEAMLGQQTQLRLISADLPEPGLELAREQRPDLVLLDIQLPGIDGFEVLRRLRADEVTRSMPVVAVSANAMPDDIERGLAAGFDAYLTKPIDQGLLVATLQRLLQRG